MNRRAVLVIALAVVAVVLSAGSLGWAMLLSTELRHLSNAQQDMEASLVTVRHRCNDLGDRLAEAKPREEEGKAGISARIEALEERIEELDKRAGGRPRPQLLPPTGVILEHLGEVGKVRAEVAGKVTKLERSGLLEEGKYRERMVNLTDLYRDAHGELSELQQKIADGGVPAAEAKKQAAVIAQR